jgi:molybdate transport system substrate-binding protein
MPRSAPCDPSRPAAALILVASCLVALVLPVPARAAQTNVAVAANFTDAARDIASAFRTATGHEAVLSFGSSAQILAQIGQDAPFQVFLSADEERPRKAIEAGQAVASSRFTYAVGKLVLWSRNSALVAGEETLRAGAFDKIAIANPAAAPYGSAALDTLRSLGLAETLQARIVQGNSIAQAFQFVQTGNAELGFVALSQVIDLKEGSRWLVPQALYRPIRQDAVLLAKGRESEAAQAFMDFLHGPEAKAIIGRYGYGDE